VGQQVAHPLGVPAVAQAVAQGDPLGRGVGLLLGRAHGGHVRVAGVPGREPERVLLGEQAGAVVAVAVAVAEDDRLGQEPPGPERLGDSQQVGRALGAQPVGQGHAAVPQGRLAQGGELVDDRVGGQPVDAPQQAVAVQGVGHHRGGPERPQPARPVPVAGQAEHLVVVGDEGEQAERRHVAVVTADLPVEGVRQGVQALATANPVRATSRPSGHHSATSSETPMPSWNAPASWIRCRL
jgi:hypothetical protein